MAEKKEAPKAEKPKKEEPKKAAPAPAEEKPEGRKGSKSAKINKMTLTEVEAKLEDVKRSQGGLRSQYARQLQKRKSLLKG